MGVTKEEEMIIVLWLKLSEVNPKTKSFYMMHKAFTKLGLFVDLPFFFRKIVSFNYIIPDSVESKIELGDYHISEKGYRLLGGMSEIELLSFFSRFEEFNIDGYNFFSKILKDRKRRSFPAGTSSSAKSKRINWRINSSLKKILLKKDFLRRCCVP